MSTYNATVLDLSRVSNLLACLNKPHNQYPVLLIAGTKGKGSTASMCESILQAAGYKTGLYTSPHLHTLRERIKLNGLPITQTQLINLVNYVAPFVDSLIGLTTWEVLTAIAFTAFSQQSVDVAVIEVGMGGRLDATNVTQPAVSVITPISYDHTHLLGNTLALIAREKAGIIRANGLVVSAPQPPEAMTVIESVCQEKKATLTVSGEETPWYIGRTTLKKQLIYLNKHPYNLPLLGKYQVINAVTALTAIDILQHKLALDIPLTAKQQGLAAVKWPGRLEILSQDPLLIVDGAMNLESVQQLSQSLQDYFPSRRLILIFGVSNDHDYMAMLAHLLPLAHYALVTQANHPRSTPLATLMTTAQTLGYTVQTSTTVQTALNQAISHLKDHDLICVTGSLFCVAEARLAWFKQTNLPLPDVDLV